MILYKNRLSKITKSETTVPRPEFCISRRCFLKSISAFSAVLLSGCQSGPENVPKIAYGYNPIDDVPPPITDTSWIPENNNSNVPWDWLPPSSVEKNWTAIIVHHSATENGNAAIFDKSHREIHGWDGVGYDFVIGNGRDSGDGEVEVTFRWRQQITGAHCGTPDNWANEDGIGICLVGNFNNRLPSDRQIQSLVKLTKFLQKRYGILKSEIFGHKNTRGAHITDCPGKIFPMARFKSMLSF